MTALSLTDTKGDTDIRPPLISMTSQKLYFMSAGKVKGQGIVWMYWSQHAESHQRDLTWEHLEGCVLLWGAPHGPVFVWGPWIILTSQRRWSGSGYENMWAEQEVVRVRKMSSQGLRFSREEFCQSAVHTLCCLFLHWACVSFSTNLDDLTKTIWILTFFFLWLFDCNVHIVCTT